MAGQLCYLIMMRTILVTSLFVSCRQHNSSGAEPETLGTSTASEVFDTGKYLANVDSTGWYAYTTQNGDSIRETAFEDGYYTTTILKASPLYELHKEYDTTGLLRSKGTILVNGPKTGLWQYFDEQGKLLKEDNEDKKFGKSGADQLLAALEKEHLINIQTGKGKAYILSISYEAGDTGRWKVLYSKTLPVIEHTYIFDGATGRLISHTNAKGIELAE